METVSHECLQQFDLRTEPFIERDIETALCRVRRELEDEGGSVPDDLTAEIIAFGFMEDYKEDGTGWGTYFGPSFVGRDDNGQIVPSPSIQCVTSDTLQYWADRAMAAKHPLLKVRYAGLVWDLSKPIAGRAGDIEMPHIVIDETVKIAADKLHQFNTDVIKKLGRALSLAQALRDDTRVELVRDAIIEFEDKVAQDGKLGLWGFSFDLVVENKRLSPPDEVREKIIGDLESRLDRVVNCDESKRRLDPHAAEAAALRLARFYRRLGRQEDVERVLRKCGKAYLIAAEESSAMVASGWLQRVYAVYLQFGMRADADIIAVDLRDFAKRSTEELAPLSHKMEIPAEEMEGFLDYMTDGDLDCVLTRIAAHFIPIRKQVEDQVKELAQSSPLVSMFPKAIVDHEGRPVAHIGGVDSDLEGNVVQQMSQNLGFTAMFLRLTFKRMQEKFHATVDDVLAHLYCSPIFDPDNRPVVDSGVSAFLSRNWIVAIHLLIPQIEDTLRTFVEQTGGTTYRMGRNGALMLKNFDELLRDDRVVETFGIDAVHYLRVLFTDQRGWNLRNRVCHGIVPADSFDASRADRVFQALLLFGQLRHDDESANGSATDGAQAAEAIATTGG